jgi:PAS domain S-box-containing protein
MTERQQTPDAVQSRAAEQAARAEAALRESEGRYTHIAANVPGMVYQFVYRADGSKEYTFVSEGVRTIFGVAPEDALRDPATLLDLVHPDDYPQFQALSLEAAATLGSFDWEGRVVLATGEERFIHVAARDQKLPDGSIASDGVVMDITELRQTARRLEESEQRYRSLFDRHPDAVYSLDLEGRFISVNPACAAVVGYVPEEMLGQSFAPLVAPEDLEMVTATFRANVGGASTHLEATILHRSGRRIQLAVTGMPITIDGRVVGVFGIAQDLTAQRELEAQLRQAQKLEAVGRLAGGVAHDFNNLLQVVQTYCSMASAQLPADAEVQSDLAEALKATKRATALTRQLLAFSRQQVLKPRRLDVNDTVTSVATMLRRIIGEDIRLETELAPAVWPVHADPGQLEQVLMNLAVNARDAMPGGGTLCLRTAAITIDERGARERPGLAPGQYAVLIVEDTGIGIAPAALPMIFEPFYTTKSHGKGTGLGLATVYGIVQQSGGYIYADSTLGAGTRLTVLLPRFEGSAAAAGKSFLLSAFPRGTETILLVEDDPDVRAVVRRQLEHLGYDVREATNGVEALGIATAPEERISLVLTDVVMPEMSGRALVEQLAAHRPDLRAVYMSGYTDDEILRRGLMQPEIAFLEKPFTLEHLADVVRRVLDEARDERETQPTTPVLRTS